MKAPTQKPKQIFYLKDESDPAKEDYEIITWIYKWKSPDNKPAYSTAFMELISKNLNLN